MIPRISRAHLHSLRQPTSRLAALVLCAIALVGLAGSRAEAACTPDPPSDDDAVSCDGTDSTGFDGSGATGLSITTVGAATLDDSDGALDSALLVSDDNTVTIGSAAVVTVTEANGFGIRGGDRNDVTNDGTIVVDTAATNGVAISVGSLNDPDPIPSIGVSNSGTITLDGANSVGIQSVDNYNLTNEFGATITINSSATGGIGIQGRDNNFVTNAGTITIEATDARGISIRDNTGTALPNGAVTSATSVITLNGDRSIGVEVGDNVGAAVSGTISLNGADTIGLSVGDQTDRDAEADLTNQGTLNVAGDRAFGIKTGDGWILFSGDATNGFVPENGKIRNRGTINVTGLDATGIFAGDESNLNGNHNSFVVNSSMIDVTGFDATAISVGGNDLLAPLDLGALDNSTAVPFTFSNSGGTITGGADAGPLIVFRDFSASGENRLLNSAGARIEADLTNMGMTDRGIAIRGSAGSELVFNAGEIIGDIELLGGDDRYVVNSNSMMTGSVNGGSGTDEAILGFIIGSAPGNFDPTPLQNFERIRIYGTQGIGGPTIGWTLTNGAGFTGITEVAADGRLVVPEGANGFNVPVTLGGNLEVDSQGSVLVTADGTNTPLSVNGDAAFDGTLIVERTFRLQNDGTYRLIQVDGDRGATTFASEMLPDTMGAYMFSTLYDVDGVSLVVVQSETFAGVAQGANRTNIATHLDGLYADPTTPLALQQQLDELFTGSGNLNNVYDALNPEAYDAQTAVIAESSLRLANLLMNRPRSCVQGELDPWQGSNKTLACHARRWSAWLAGIGSFRDRDSFAGHTEYDAQIGGAVFGIDARPIGDLELTLAISSQAGKIHVNGYGDSDLVLADISGHAAWSLGPLRLQGVATWGYGSHDSRRSIYFDESATAVNLRAEDDYNSQHAALSGQAGVLIDLGPIDLEPLVGVDYTWISQDAIRETGAGLYGERVEHRDDDIVSVVGGLRLSTVYHHTRYLNDNLLWMDGIWRPMIDLRWRETLSGNERSLTARLEGAPDTVGSFSVDADEDDGGFEIGAGVSFVPENANRLQFDLRYDAYRASHTVEHDLVAKVRIGF